MCSAPKHETLWCNHNQINVFSTAFAYSVILQNLREQRVEMLICYIYSTENTLKKKNLFPCDLKHQKKRRKYFFVLPLFVECFPFGESVHFQQKKILIIATAERANSISFKIVRGNSSHLGDYISGNNADLSSFSLGKRCHRQLDSGSEKDIV